jgi:branched-chain amino acid aminotransferase
MTDDATDDTNETTDTSDPLFHVDGDLVPASEATVNVRDRGFMYGDGAFETLRAYGGTIFEWDAHRKRLQRTADTLGFPEAVPDDLHARIEDTLTANDLADAYVKVSVTRGVQPGTVTPHEDVDPTVVVYVKPLPRGGTEGEPVWDGPATVQTVRTRKVSDDALPADAKTHNYLNSILARLELRKAATDEFQADEALLRDAEDHVAEGATSNVFFVADDALRTPTADLDLLPGVTRSVVIDLAENEGFPVDAARYTVDDFRNADELFLTNSTWEIRPVTSLDGIEFQVGPMTKLLARLYDERVGQSCY